MNVLQGISLVLPKGLIWEIVIFYCIFGRIVLDVRFFYGREDSIPTESDTWLEVGDDYYSLAL